MYEICVTWICSFRYFDKQNSETTSQYKLEGTQVLDFSEITIQKSLEDIDNYTVEFVFVEASNCYWRPGLQQSLQWPLRPKDSAYDFCSSI